MKNRLKIFTIIISLMISFVMIACDTLDYTQINFNNEKKETNKNSYNETNDEKTIETLKDLPFYEKYYPNDLAKTMASNKNKDYEMQVGVYETYDEMIAEYFKTFVSIKADFYDSHAKDNRFGLGSGNIYDIDDEYMYIITCIHLMRNNEEDEIKEFNIRFVDDTRIIISSSDCLYKREDGVDIALIKIPLSYFSQDTLSIVKTINIDNLYNISKEDFLNSTLYCYRYRDLMYNISFVQNIKQCGETFTLDCSIEKGTSGGGVIDVYGNYYTLILNEATLSLKMLSYFNDLLIIAKEQ